MRNADFVTENMVHVLPELIHSCPLGRAARAAEKQQCKSSQDSEVIIQLPFALPITLITNADQNTLQLCNICFKYSNLHSSDKKMRHICLYPNYKRTNQQTSAYLSLGIPQNIN